MQSKNLGMFSVLYMVKSAVNFLFRRCKRLSIIDYQQSGSDGSKSLVSLHSARVSLYLLLVMAEELAYRYVVLRPARIRCFLANGNGFDLLPSARGNSALEYQFAPFLTGAAQEFAVALSTL